MFTKNAQIPLKLHYVKEEDGKYPVLKQREVEVLLFLKNAEACSFQGKITCKKLFLSELSCLDMLAYTRPQEWNAVIYRQVA